MLHLRGRPPSALSAELALASGCDSAEPCRPLAPLPLLLPLPDATEWLTSGPRVLQVFVEPEERGQGLGEIVMQAALISALERGRKVAHLLVCDRNERAVNLYKRTGFTKDFDNSKEDTVHNVIMGE